MLQARAVSLSWAWVAVVMAVGGCDPVQRYRAPGRTAASVLPPRSEGLGEQIYEVTVTPQVTYRLHAYWFGGVVNLIGELDNDSATTIIVDDRRAMLELDHGRRARAGTLSPGTELFVGELAPSDKHKTHYKFPVPTLEEAADVKFIHEGLTSVSGEPLRVVVELVDADAK